MTGTPLPGETLLRGLRRLLRDVEHTATATRMGLDETPIGETQMSRVGEQSVYRGYAVSELANECSFIEVAWLLIHGDLPDEDLLADFRCVMMESAQVDPMLADWVESVPLHVPAVDVLRSAVSMLSHFDPYLDQGTPEAIANRAQRLLAQLPGLLSLRVSRQRGMSEPQADEDLTYVANLHLALTGEIPSADQERVLNRLLILNACHGFDGPTVAARTTSSCRSDFYSAVLAGISAVKGAEELGGVRQHLLAIHELTKSRTLVADVRSLLGEGPLDGFVCATRDSRGALLADDCRRLAVTPAHRKMEATALGVQRVVHEVCGLVPDLRWNSARVLHYLGFDSEVFAPVLAIARIPGWAGHCREQMRSIERVRPVARYVGPESRPFQRLAERC